jgi:hypothetical protein
MTKENYKSTILLPEMKHKSNTNKWGINNKIVKKKSHNLSQYVHQSKA